MRTVALVLAALLLAPAQASASVVFDQLNDDRSEFETGFGTQRFEAIYADYDWAGVDDFTLAHDTRLTKLTAQFLGWDGFTSTDNILSYGLEIYSVAEQADVSLTGDVASLTLLPGDISVSDLFPLSGGLEGISGWRIDADIDVTLAAGTYWLAVIPRLDYETGGQTSILSWGNGRDGKVFHANPGGGMAIDHRFSPDGILNVRLEGDVLGVPEPATWALMIGGFGLAGAALRRRRGALA